MQNTNSDLERSAMQLILYSKPGCHLCEGLQEKLVQIQSLNLKLEIRDITTREDWFQAYQYEIPVLFWVRGEAGGEGKEAGGGRRDEREERGEEDRETWGHGDGENASIQNSKFKIQNSDSSCLIPLPRPSPRSTVRQLEQMLQKYVQGDREQ